MKNKILALAMLIGSSLLSALFLDVKCQLNEKKIGLGDFNRLVVKSKLKVVLVESAKTDTARTEGSKKFVESIVILQSGEDLIVRSKSFKDQKKEGTIYIPVHNLRYLEINSDATIISYTAILSPELNVLVDGDCVVNLLLKGKLNIEAAEGYKSAFRRLNHQSHSPIYPGDLF